MQQEELIPHLFRTEYSKIVAVLCKLFGIGYIALAEDITSDTFMLATETWGQKGLPQNPAAWLYTVAKNKAKDTLKRNILFDKNIAPDIKRSGTEQYEMDIDLSDRNISDSQLQMMFTICNPCLTAESQIGLCLNILCGFGAEEIADAFLSNKETIYKRLARAKEKLRTERIKIEFPSPEDIAGRLNPVLTTLYLLFNEGYYSSSRNTSLRRELCVEAMRLNHMLTENDGTDLPQANALLALMCFHSSRFDARIDKDGAIILYEEQDENLWSKELIEKGEYYLNRASQGTYLSKYHLEAAIAYWHTKQKDTHEKWENILQLYNRLLQIEYSPAAALNRTYAVAKADGKEKGLIEAKKLNLSGNHWYHALLAELYTGIDDGESLTQLSLALLYAKTTADKQVLEKKILTRVK